MSDGFEAGCCYNVLRKLQTDRDSMDICIYILFSLFKLKTHSLVAMWDEAYIAIYIQLLFVCLPILNIIIRVNGSL